MKRKRWMILGFVLALAVALLLRAPSALAGNPSALTLAAHQIPWLLPLTGSGGESASVNYKVSDTIGQVAVNGRINDSGSVMTLGFWQIDPPYRVMLPVIVR